MDLRSAIVGVTITFISAVGSVGGVVAAQAPTPTVNAGIRSAALTIKPPFHISEVEGCIGFEGGLSSNTILQVSDCHESIRVSGTIGHQKWTWVGISKNNNGEFDTFAFRNTASNTCISVQNNSLASGALLVHQECNYQNPSQLWMTTRPDSVAWWGRTELVNLRSGKCAYPVGMTVKPAYLEQLDCIGNSSWHYFEAILEQV